MKKPIKIDPHRAYVNTCDKVEQALKSVNGQAYEHAYTDYSQIRELAHYVECKLYTWGIPKNAWKGVVIHATSGEPVSNAYATRGFHRAATHVLIERRASGWFLTTVEKTHVWQQGGDVTIVLTPEQDRIAVERLRDQYIVMTHLE